MTSNTIKDNLNSPNVDVSLKKSGLTKADIKPLADNGELQESPMLYFSSGSKELFHSNFLYWLGITYRESFQSMMSEFLNITKDWPEGWTVRREHNHLDLCVTYIPKTLRRKNSGTGEHVFIIVENKVKSVPDITQLKRYEDLYVNKKEDCTYVLLSLMKEFHGKDILERGDEIKWQIHNYEELADHIEETFINKFPVRDEHKQYVSDYCKYIRNLSKMAEGWSIGESDFFLSTKDKLNELRLVDIYEKIRYAQVAVLLMEKLNTLSKNNIKIVLGMSNFDVILGKRKDSEKILSLYGCKDVSPFDHIFISSGMAHSIGLFEAKIKISKDCCAVIQVQGDRYCHGIEKKGIVGKSKQLKQNNTELWSFINFNDNADSKLCHYSDGFLYMAQKVSEKDTVADIISSVIKDINTILKWQTLGKLII